MSDDELIETLQTLASEAREGLAEPMRRAAVRIGELRANHVLAAGIIAGVGFATQRKDLIEHAEIMKANLGMPSTWKDPRTATNPASKEGA